MASLKDPNRGVRVDTLWRPRGSCLHATVHVEERTYPEGPDTIRIVCKCKCPNPSGGMEPCSKRPFACELQRMFSTKDDVVVGILYYSRPSTLNYEVLMGSEALVLGFSSNAKDQSHPVRKSACRGRHQKVTKRISPTNGKRRRCYTRTSHEVTNPSTTLAQGRLTPEF
ncbi:hypothetical protein VNO77_34626 [Canavalia gladiata]|uniref:Uncharacterized protein n=1 Tax=Canavalia gladiata TaxID=3824 RepID=A0AAN9KHU3_CANGL